MTLYPVVFPDHEPLPSPCVFHVSACAHVCACVRPFCRPASRVRTCPGACVRVFQESQWLDSVSLLIQDTLEGEMLMIDNLSGSVFHHYSSPPICRDCKGHLQEVPPPPQHYHEGPRTELQISSLSHCRCFRSVRKCELTTASKASTTVFILHFIPCVPTESTLLSTEHRSGRQACRFARALMDVHTLRASFIA